MTNTFSDFIHYAGGQDRDRASTAAMLVLADKINGRDYRTLAEYQAAAVVVERQFGHGAVAAMLIAAGWLDEPEPK